jgi:hypothetical protein
MSVEFGFSAGDFIAAIKLVAIVIDALWESGNSCADNREIISPLLTLQTAPLGMEQIELDEVQHTQPVALQQAAT